MSSHEYWLVAGGWAVLIIVLTIFWYATLNKLAGLLKERLKETKSSQPITGVVSVFKYLVRGQFKQTGDERLMALCKKLRQLLYGYIGVTIAYFVFLELMHPKY
jgi:hypothetical protein